MAETAESSAKSSPAPSPSNVGSMNDSEKFIAQAELVKGHVDALVTVATAVLVLSITFLKDCNIGVAAHKYYLKLSWVLFTLSILSGIICSYTLLLLVREETCWANTTCKHRTVIFWSIIFLHLLFFAAVAVFLFFALINI